MIQKLITLNYFIFLILFSLRVFGYVEIPLYLIFSIIVFPLLVFTLYACVNLLILLIILIYKYICYQAKKILPN